MQEQETEHEDAGHHRQGAGVVRVRADDEPFVLRVLQRPHRNLENRSTVIQTISYGDKYGGFFS